MLHIPSLKSVLSNFLLQPAVILSVNLSISLTLSGCFGGKGDLSSLSPPPIESQIPTEYEELKASQTQRPLWIDKALEDADGMHFLVGLSEHHSSERAAREDAMRHAREQYAKYTGVDVELVDKVIRTLHGVSSDVFDPTVSGTSKSTHTTEAQVSRIKAKEWYWVKYRAVKRGTFRGNVYKYWVLVTVPIDEYDRVQELKKKWADEEMLLEQNLASQADAALSQSLSHYNEALAAIQYATNNGEILLALSKIQEEWNRLYSDIKRFTDKGSPYSDKITDLQQAQQNLTGTATATIRSSLYIDTGRRSAVYIPPNSNETHFPVWVWIKTSGSKKPVSGMPLILKDLQNNIITHAFTAPTGKASFRPTGLTPGQYHIAIDAKSPTFSTVDQTLINVIANLENSIYATYAKTDMKGASDIAIKKLFHGPAMEQLPVNSITVGPVTYAETMQGGNFAHMMQQIFRQSLTAIEGLTVVAPKKRNPQSISRAVNIRGIGLQSSPDQTNSIGSAAMQAYMDGAQAAVEATYTVHTNEVWVNISLKEAGTNILKAASTAVIDRRTIPRELALIPQISSMPTPETSNSPGGSINLQLTSHLGDGQTYVEGDIISYFAGMDRDAYLVLVYKDAENNLIQLLPNKYSGRGFYRAGNYIEVPGKHDRFEFVIQAPFGLEQVWAFAATRPLPSLRGKPLENGLTLITDSLDTVLNKMRSFGSAPGVAYGEKNTSITTVARTSYK